MNWKLKFTFELLWNISDVFDKNAANWICQTNQSKWWLNNSESMFVFLQNKNYFDINDIITKVSQSW